MEWLLLLMIVTVFAALLSGFPVAFTLAGVSLLFAGLGTLLGQFDYALLGATPNRLFGIMLNQTLVAVPLFVLMGVLLEKARVADDLLENMSALFGRRPGGLGLSMMLVGAILAASTGIVGATVVTLGLIALPVMLRRGYDPRLASGSVAAAGTLGQIIPPSIILVLLGDQLSNAYTQAQLEQGIFSPETVAVGDLFSGALIPGLILVGAYAAYILFVAWRQPHRVPGLTADELAQRPPIGRLLLALAPPILLIVLVLGSIMGGIATPTEAAGVGAVGALLLALLKRRLTWPVLQDSLTSTLRVTAMVFMIFIGASIFSLVFRGFGGDALVHDLLSGLPGGAMTALLLVMVVVFLLGFMLDFIEITFVVVPIVAPVLLMMGIDPVWLGVLLAVNLQTSFLTPPFGFSLFYLRGAAPASIETRQIYRGVLPFIAIQIAVIALLVLFPDLVTWLPESLDVRAHQ
ncbi:TRAP transporter large permease subunit [Guyparkeria hydrothermalis]|uniref:TRAP transporter large permease n=1 Tax=Guyparkeria hydrothermalis TaxID=923 RepID=UPI0020218BAB|nr:TRAP transporter large permease subunit [Guyparkeria hydrothermalis]MCL7743764.1 TRAP transporter large permease subunit [Guyparkeria hydrothermalis]